MKDTKKPFQVLNYEYMNTGGNTMVGIFTVWLPDKKQTVYALTNEAGCNIAVVDYISNELDIDDYDELIIDHCVFDFLTSDDDYFELYRYCLNEYIKSDYKHFGYVKPIPFHLLSNELRAKIDVDYLVWLCKHKPDVYTDGENIVVDPDYHNYMLEEIKNFKSFHDTTAANKVYYHEYYTIAFAGRTIKLPFNADTWTSIDYLLQNTIEEW